MDFYTVITKPWRTPLSYLELAFWFMVFLIVAYALMDSLRITASFIASTAKG